MEHFYFSQLFIFFSFIILSLFVTILFKHKSNCKRTNLPPGNLGLPFLGESLDFLASTKKGKPEKFIFDRIAKYSTEIFKTNIFSQTIVVVCGAAANKFLFSNENKLVVVWWPNFVNKIFPSLVPTSTIERTKQLRMVLPKFLKPEALQRYVGIMDSIAQRHFASEWENREEVLVFPLTKSYTFASACRLFLSLEDPNCIARFAIRFSHVTSGIFCIPIDLPGTSFYRAIKASKFIRNEIFYIINQRKKDLAEGKASPSQDILSHVLLKCDEDGLYTTELEIANYILALLMAGHDSTSGACTFIVNYLAELPHIYEGVHKEQMQIAKSKLPGELLNWNDIQKMKYSWNVVCEVLRLVPPLLGTFREAIKEFSFNGFCIPKGWKLYWSTTTTHKDPKYFLDPEKFDPSRFEGNGPAPYTFVPFGGGARMCPGKEFARLEILIFMHHLVKRFRFTKVISDEKIVYDPIPIPTKGLPIRLHPHKADHDY